MSLIVPNSGDINFLNQILSNNIKLHLYSNNITLSKSTILSNFVECTLSGYSPITLLSSNWTISTISNVTVATHIPVVFHFTVSGIIQGYYITDITSSTLLWCQANQVSLISSGMAGVSLQVLLTIGLD